MNDRRRPVLVQLRRENNLFQYQRMKLSASQGKENLVNTNCKVYLCMFLALMQKEKGTTLQIDQKNDVILSPRIVIQRKG